MLFHLADPDTLVAQATFFGSAQEDGGDSRFKIAGRICRVEQADVDLALKEGTGNGISAGGDADFNDPLKLFREEVLHVVLYGKKFFRLIGCLDRYDYFFQAEFPVGTRSIVALWVFPAGGKK